MRIINRSVNLNEMCRVENLSGVAFTGENGGHRFVITGFAGNERVYFEGGIAGQFRCPDGTSVAFTASYASVDADGRAVVTLPGNCYTHGTGPFGILITNVVNAKPSAIYAAAGFMQTGEAVSPVDPENTVNVDAILGIIDDMYTAIAACAAATEFIPDVIAPEYNYLSTYAVGDPVSVFDQNDGWGVYWCNTAITTAGSSWGTNKSKFTKIPVATELARVSAFAQDMRAQSQNHFKAAEEILYAYTTMVSPRWVIGRLNPATGALVNEGTDLIRSDFRPVQPGNTYRISAADGFKFKVFYYTTNNASTFQRSDPDWTVGSQIVFGASDTSVYYIKVLCGYTDGRTISDADAAAENLAWGIVESNVMPKDAAEDFADADDFDALADDFSENALRQSEFEAFAGVTNGFDPYRFENGSINAGEDTDYHADWRVRLKGWGHAKFDFEVWSDAGYEYGVWTKTASDGTAVSSGWQNSSSKYLIRKGLYYRLLMRNTSRDGSGTAITVAEMLPHFRIMSAAYGIVGRNPDAKRRLYSLKRHKQDLNGYSGDIHANHNNNFAIAHISDIHLDAVRYQNFIDFCDYYKDLINDRICTGDYVNVPTDGTGGTDDEIGYMRDIETTKTVLYCVGNHERSGGSGTGQTRQQVYEKWGLAQWYIDTGVTPGDNSDYPLYYYKDYVDTDTIKGYKVRLIVLNNCDNGGETSTSAEVNCYSTAQMAWFVETLQDAADNGFAVVVGTHFAESEIVAPGNASFYTRDSRVSSEICDVPVCENIIDAFRNGTTYTATAVKARSVSTAIDVDADFTNHQGQFLGWMVGHQHKDRIGYSANHPDQLYLMIVDGRLHRTNSDTYPDSTFYSDLPRVENERSQDAFNVYSFDLKNKLCKVMRVGSDLNDMMVPREFACFETEPTVVSNNG